jgi:DNA-binding transcriptional regulator/RsmH inhibitor MraZ
MNVRLNVMWLLALAAGLGMYGLSLAQEATAPAALAPPATSAARPMYAPLMEDAYRAIADMPGRVNVAPSIRQAAEAVRDAEGPQAKVDAQVKLTEYLAKYFDDDMARREAELKQIEQRLAKLRELLDRRRNSKQEIIELQAKVALNEADGLGFYEGERTNDLDRPGASNFGGGLAPPAADPVILSPAK